jgi:endonuclease-3
MSAASVRAVCRALGKEFGPVDPKRYRGDPLDELVATILSQSTTDTNSARAFASLKRRFPRWSMVLQAPPARIAAAIRPGGLANVKSKAIRNALRSIDEREGRLSLSRLRSMSDEDATAYLTAIPGVGVKTASCVLLFAMGRNAFPVDTHVFRVTRRLGWLASPVPIERAGETLRRHIPDGLSLPLHLYLVWHGRRTCRAQRPRCSACPIRRRCAWGGPPRPGPSREALTPRAGQPRARSGAPAPPTAARSARGRASARGARRAPPAGRRGTR